MSSSISLSILFCWLISSLIFPAISPTRVTTSPSSSNVSSWCCISNEVCAWLSIMNEVFSRSRSVVAPNMPLSPALRIARFLSSLRILSFTLSEFISSLARASRSWEELTSDFRSYNWESSIWTNFCLSLSTNWTVVCTSRNVDSALFICLFSCFLESLNSWVLTAVS